MSKSGSNCSEKDVGNNCGVGGNWRGPGTGAGNQARKGKTALRASGIWVLEKGLLLCAVGDDVRMHVHLTT